MIRVKKAEYSFFLYCYIQYLYNQDEFFNLENGSSGIKNLDYKALLFELDYPMPHQNLVLDFHKQVEPLFKKVNQNKIQIRTLTALRDTLLPKLMSGEVRVL
jgi:type I restriction enzyme S subunit